MVLDKKRAESSFITLQAFQRNRAVIATPHIQVSFRFLFKKDLLFYPGLPICMKLESSPIIMQRLIS